jgi:hypothetical protein
MLFWNVFEPIWKRLLLPILVIVALSWLLFGCYPWELLDFGF